MNIKETLNLVSVVIKDAEQYLSENVFEEIIGETEKYGYLKWSPSDKKIYLKTVYQVKQLHQFEIDERLIGYSMIPSFLTYCEDMIKNKIDSKMIESVRKQVSEFLTQR